MVLSIYLFFGIHKRENWGDEKGLEALSPDSFNDHLRTFHLEGFLGFISLNFFFVAKQ